ncbi:hypothetical protein ACA910_002059 [Epithemia clementina (nom. ined.)]
MKQPDEELSSSKPHTIMARETSLGAQGLKETDDCDPETRGYAPDDDEELEDEACDLPPGRIHATRSTSAIRLRGSRHNNNINTSSSLPNFMSGIGGVGGTTTPSDGSVSSTGSTGSGNNNNYNKPLFDQQPQPQRRANSTGNMGHHLHHHHASPRSKSPSFQLRSGGSTAATAAPTMDGNSSISSLEDLVDSDILYDRAGLIDIDVLSSSTGSLDGSKSQGGRKASSSREFVNLPSVNERLSDETLEDVHAFSDVKVNTSGSSNASRANSLTDAGDEKVVLDPLEEGDDEDGDEDDDQDSLEDPSESSEMHMSPVILTNIENLSLQAQQNVVAEHDQRHHHQEEQYSYGGGNNSTDAIVESFSGQRDDLLVPPNEEDEDEQPPSSKDV